VGPGAGALSAGGGGGGTIPPAGGRAAAGLDSESGCWKAEGGGGALGWEVDMAGMDAGKDSGALFKSTN